ncbi:hypothetical protein, partial [Pseudomonas aeruginosa]|uniref:hypothetical protein n=1 Tax=Pseudomonas aeruginosa TaxID=287 RepID=UPI0022CDE963
MQSDASWKELNLGDVIELKRGYDLPKGKRSVGGRRQKLSATPDLSGTVLPLCLIPNSALKSAPPFKSVV